MLQSQASPHPSSSVASSLGLISIFLGCCNVSLPLRVGPVPDTVDFTNRAGGSFVGAALLSPLGNGFLAFAFACAANQPAKSGSPPSSNAAGAAERTGLAEPNASKNVSSSSPVGLSLFIVP